MLRDERRECCPACGQMLLGVRHGVALGPFKVRIFDAIKRAGSYGIESSALSAVIYADRPHGRRAALAENIYQINNLLASTDWRIRGSGSTHARVYRVVKE